MFSGKCLSKRQPGQVLAKSLLPYVSKNQHSRAAKCEQSFFCYFQCVLHFMVGSKEAADGVSRDVVHVLLHGGLMRR